MYLPSAPPKYLVVLEITGDVKNSHVVALQMDIESPAYYQVKELVARDVRL